MIQCDDSIRRFTSVRQVIDVAVPATHSAHTGAAERCGTALLR